MKVEVYSPEEVEHLISTAKARIEKAINQNGPYSHNMATATLGDLADKLGYRIANDLLAFYELDELFEIPPMEESAAALLTSAVPYNRKLGALDRIYKDYKVEG